MIHPSFIPPRSIRESRDLTRRRERLNGAGTSEKNRVQKILEDANVKLGNVLSDVFGVSGQLMLEALLKEEAKPEETARFARGRAKKKIPEIMAALDGRQMSEHHRKMIRYHYSPAIMHVESGTCGIPISASGTNAQQNSIETGLQ